MKLSAYTVALLKNCAEINKSILIRSGKTLKTMSVSKSTLLRVDITEEFDRDVAIYDLPQFLNCLSLVDNPEILLEEDYIDITNGTDSIEYRYSDPSVITAPPERELELPSEDICLVLTDEVIQTVKKIPKVLDIHDLSFIGDGEKITLTLSDEVNSGKNSYKIEVGKSDSKFKFQIKVDNLLLVAGDYDVVISKSNLAKFTNHSNPAVYYVALEPDSVFEG